MKNNGKVEQLTKLIMVLFTAYRQKHDEKLLTLYVGMLKEVDTEWLKRRVDTLIKTSKFFPTVAEILAEVREDEQRKLEAEENGFIDRFIHTRNNNLSFKPLAPDVYTIKRHLGWYRVEDCNTKELTWIIKEAREAYRALRDGTLYLVHDPNEQRIKYLPGSSVRYIPKGDKDTVSSPTGVMDILRNMTLNAPSSN